MMSESFPAPSIYQVVSRFAKVEPIVNGSVCPYTGAIQLMVGYSVVNLMPIEKGEKYIAIDGGMDKKARFVAWYLSRIGQDTSDILALYNTHPHLDHLGLVHVLPPEAPIYISEEDSPVLTGSKTSEGPVPRLLHHIFNPSKAGIKPTVFQPGENHKYGSTNISAISTPGHTGGSLSYEVQTPDGKALFTGDAFDNGQDKSIKLPPRITSADMWQSRKTLDVLAAYAEDNPQASFYPSHSAAISARQYLERYAKLS